MSSFFGGQFFSGSFYGQDVIPEVFALGQGDDYPGWDKKAWKKKQAREEALEQTIVQAYKKITGEIPEIEEVIEVKKAVQAEVLETKKQFEDYSDLLNWLQTTDILINKIVHDLYMRELDDEETLLLLS